MAMRRVADAQWEPTVPALVQLVAASGAPHLRAAFAAAGLDGIRPAQSAVLVPLASTLSSRSVRDTSATANVGGGGAEKNAARAPKTRSRRMAAIRA